MNNKLANIIRFTSTASLLLFTSTWAASLATKSIVKNRAKYRSEWSQSRDMPLEVSHIDHTKDADYDSPDTVEYITLLEHLAYHIYWQRNPANIGLNRHSNKWAIEQITDSLVGYLQSQI